MLEGKRRLGWKGKEIQGRQGREIGLEGEGDAELEGKDGRVCTQRTEGREGG